MTISQRHVAALQALLTGDDETFDRLIAAADFYNGEGFSILVVNAFYSAAQRRFPPGWSVGDVVRYVGHLRARTAGDIENLSAVAAEQMLIRALSGAPLTGEFDENTRAVAQVLLLADLLSDLDEQELGTFLAEARERADAWAAKNAT